MSRGMNQKIKLPVLERILLQETDEEHPMSVRRMMERLQDHGIDVRDRKSVYDDLEALEQLGVDVNRRRDGHDFVYYVGERQFQLPELKLLVDAVQSSRFITQKKTAQLIRKLESLASVHEGRQLQRQVFVARRIKSMNESIYYTVDALHDAIDQGRQIRFRYFEWAVNGTAHKLEKRLRHDGKWYRVSPWRLLWDSDSYYLIAFDSDMGAVRHYRVDKMQELSITDEPREGEKEIGDLDLDEYAGSLFGMFQGEKQQVRLRFSPNLAGVIVDRFGKDDLFWSQAEDGRIEVTHSIAVSPQFLGWVFGLGEGAEIVAPESVRQQYIQMLERVKERYNK